ncbi:MAG: hypothetical protein ACLP19_27160 [Xanthobacteraceae bacterium]
MKVNEIPLDDIEWLVQSQLPGVRRWKRTDSELFDQRDYDALMRVRAWLDVQKIGMAPDEPDGDFSDCSYG